MQTARSGAPPDLRAVSVEILQHLSAGAIPPPELLVRREEALKALLHECGLAVATVEPFQLEDLAELDRQILMAANHLRAGLVARSTELRSQSSVHNFCQPGTPALAGVNVTA